MSDDPPLTKHHPSGTLTAATYRASDGTLRHWRIRSTYDEEGRTMANVVTLAASPEGVRGSGASLHVGPLFELDVEILFEERDHGYRTTPRMRRHMGMYYVSWFGALRSEAARTVGGRAPQSCYEVTSPDDPFAAFAGALDPELVSQVWFGTAKGARPHDLGDEHLALCWTGLDRTLGADGTLGRALAAVPGLGAVVADAWVHDREAVRDAVGSGDVEVFLGRWVAKRGILPRRLLPAVVDLSSALPTMPAMVASMAAADARALSSGDEFAEWRCVPVDAVRRLASVPASWVPRGRDEWEAFAKLCPVLDRFSPMVSDETGWSRLLNHGGRWAECAARLNGLVGGRGAWHAGEDLDDVAASYATQVLGPCVAAATCGAVEPDGTDRDAWTGAARSLLFSGRSLARQVEVAAAWHRRQHRIRAGIAAMVAPGTDALAWRAGLGDATYGDVSVRVLTDEVQLLAEGAYGSEDGAEGLDHCVGGYGPACRGGGTRVLSIRRVLPEGAFERLSTVEVLVDGDRLVVEQHKGRGNGDPDPAAVAALALYAADVAAGRVPVDHEALAPVPEADALAFCGYDAGDPEMRAAARALWHGIEPGTVAAMDEATLASWAVSLLGPAKWRTEPFGSPSDVTPELPTATVPHTP